MRIRNAPAGAELIKVTISSRLPGGAPRPCGNGALVAGRRPELIEITQEEYAALLEDGLVAVAVEDAGNRPTDPERAAMQAEALRLTAEVAAAQAELAQARAEIHELRQQLAASRGSDEDDQPGHSGTSTTLAGGPQKSRMRKE